MGNLTGSPKKLQARTPRSELQRSLVPLIALALLLLSGQASAQVTAPQLSVDGAIESRSVGVMFPDGSVQGTAAGSVVYDNRIADCAPPLPYTEVCLKDGQVQSDIHTVGNESTAGGQCEPGDRGWIIERDERAAAPWEEALLTCLLADMRLPEVFELKLSCRRDVTLGLNDLRDDNEWSANRTIPISNETGGGAGVPTVGGQDCIGGGWGWLLHNDGFESTVPFRCVK